MVTQEKAEQLMRLENYIHLMGLTSDENSHVKMIQELIWENDFTKDMFHWIHDSIKEIASLTYKDTIERNPNKTKEKKATRANRIRKWGMDETLHKDISLLLHTIQTVHFSLSSLTEETPELNQLLANTKNRCVKSITFHFEKSKDIPSKNAIKLESKDIIKFILDTINEKRMKIYENLISGIIRDARIKENRRFLCKATYALNTFLEKNYHLIPDVRIVGLIVECYQYIGILSKTPASMDPDSIRKKINNWKIEGEKLTQEDK